MEHRRDIYMQVQKPWKQASARCEVDFEAQNKHADASGHLLKLLHLSWIYDVDGNRAPNTKSAG
jgi:hypothetical protein